METRRIPLQPECYYQIYNRGINGQDIFLEERNYPYFFEKYSRFVHPFFETYAYCLLKNHFHLLVRARSEEDLRHLMNGKHKEKSCSYILSNAFGTFFKSYSLSINKCYDRTGGLFEEPFRRIPIESDSYFTRLIHYIHFNPQKHGFVDDFRKYPYSSYQSHMHSKETKLNRNYVLNWFDGLDQYIRFHEQMQEDT